MVAALELGSPVVERHTWMQRSPNQQPPPADLEGAAAPRSARPPRPFPTRRGFLAVLPGAVLGTHAAGLLYFLNPGLRFSATSLTLSILVFATLYGALGALISWRLLRRRADRATGWSLTLVFILAAVSYAAHASYYSYYSPPGINRRLLKAAVWLAVAALVTFYTALLHSLHRRPWGRRSQTGALILIVLSVYVMIERREAFQRTVRTAPGFFSRYRPEPTNLLVVGAEAASLDVILPLREQGTLPFLSDVLQNGVYARLEALAPLRHDPAWVTLVTGTLPHRHQVRSASLHRLPWQQDSAEIDLLPPTPLRFFWSLPLARVASADARRARRPDLPALLDRFEVPSRRFGWPAAEHLVPLAPPEEPSTPPPTSLRAEALAGLAPELQMLLRRSAEVDEMAVHRALHWQDRLPQAGQRAVFVGLPGLSAVSLATYGGFESLRFEARTTPNAQMAERALTVFYQHTDALLSTLWNRLPAPKILAFVSAHGVDGPPRWLDLWRGITSREVAKDGRFSAAADGVLVLYGTPFVRGNYLGQERSLDVVPTLLYSLGLPIARDLEGRVLTDAFTAEFLAQPLSWVGTYGTVDRRSERDSEIERIEAPPSSPGGSGPGADRSPDSPVITR